MRTAFFWAWLVALLLLVTTNPASAQPWQFTIVEQWERAASIILDNEIGPDKAGATGNFSWNPLALNGKPLDYTQFGGFSKGLLCVVKGKPEIMDPETIPFHIYLRRDGMIINEGKSSSTREVFRIEISEVLKLAKPGDHLIIEPVRKADRQAKRIIKVIGGGGC